MDRLKTKVLDIKNLKLLIAEAVQEVLDDPDFEMELSEEAKNRLRRASKTPRRSTAKLAEIKRRHS